MFVPHLLSAPTSSARLVGGMLLAPVPESAGKARSELATVLQVVCPGYDPADCMLMLSELVANAVEHAKVDGEWVIHVACWRDGNLFWVEVYDPGGGEPAVRSAGPEDTDGRGLLIVDVWSHEWGSGQTPEGGTVVWFAVRLD